MHPQRHLPQLRDGLLGLLGALLGRDRTRAVFTGRTVPLFRSVISPPAGVERMSPTRFLLLTTAGSLVWNSVFVVAGSLLGANWHVVDDCAGAFQTVVLAAVAIAVVLLVVVRVRARRSLPEDSF